MHILRKLLITLLTTVALGTQAQQYEPLTSFKDATFRTYLQTAYKTALSEDGKSIDVLQVLQVAINSESYKAITSLEGIKKLVNLKYIYLPGKTSSNYGFALKSLDVSDMPNLEIIDNGCYTSSAVGTSTPINVSASASGNNVTCAITSVIADNCPKLKYVALGMSKWANLKTVSLKNCSNIEALYLPSVEIETLDLSGFPKLANKIRTSGYNGGWATTSLNKNNNIALCNMSSLKELIIGEHPDITTLSIYYCPNFETLDISGLPNLTNFDYRGSSNTSSLTSTSAVRGVGKLKNLIMAEKHPNMKTFSVYFNSLPSLDITPFCETVTSFQARSGYLTEIDLTKFPKATAVDVMLNNIWHLDLPPQKTLSHWAYKGNKITYLPVPPAGVKYTVTSNGDYNECSRNVGQVTKYKVFDDPSFAQNVMLTEGGGLSTHRDYYAPSGGHIGVAADGEDPCYFYFDDATNDGVYYFKHSAAIESCSYCKITLKRTTPGEYDPAAEQFWIAMANNNWVPRDVDKFVVTDSENGMYILNHPYDLHGEFRIVNSDKPENVSISLGGHSDDKYAHGADKHGGDHVFFNVDYFYQLDQNPNVHFTTHPSYPHLMQGWLERPRFTFHYQPETFAKASALKSNGDTQMPSYNFLKADGTVVTKVNDLTADPIGNASAEYFNLQGVRIANPAPGQVVIVRQGDKVTKQLVR